jgi:uncharacterized repeat protein (TIGR03803 family)
MPCSRLSFSSPVSIQPVNRLASPSERFVNLRHARQVQRLIALAIVLAVNAPALHGQTYSVLFNFGTISCSPENAADPGIIAQGRDGNLYSTTPDGGCISTGSAFKITPGGDLTPLYSFGSQAGDSTFPYSGLTLSQNGSFWGTSNGGGGNGNIFNISSSGALTNFNVLGGTGNADGIVPNAPPVQGMDGNFYGVTSAGGNSDLCTYGSGGCGVIYKMTGSGAYTVIYTFNQTQGANPYGPLVLGTDGNFYGTAELGGTVGSTLEDEGVVFKFTPAGKYTVLYTFCSLANCVDGAYPFAGLVQGSDGNFYGTTQSGGNGITDEHQGVVFKVTPAGVLTVLYNFCSVTGCTDGETPVGGLVQATDGNFYGVTELGGKYGFGTIYQITPAGAYTVVYNFCPSAPCTDGAYPREALVQNTNGILYGDTFRGGSNGAGVFHSLNMNLKPFVSMVNWYGKVGQTIEILGQGFTGATDVSFNGTSAAFTVGSATYLTAVVPSDTTTGFVTVTTPSGTLTSNRKFIIQPFIQNFNPTSGDVGTSVQINGTSFTGTSKISFGGEAATSFTVDSDIEITTAVPSGAKTGKITVTTPGGTAASATNFLVIPQITSFSPHSGPVGTVVTITGVSLTQTTSVTFNGVAATSVTVNSDTQVTATVPTGATTGKIAVTTPGGTATSATNFVVTPSS